MNVPIFNDPVASFSYFSSQIKLGKQEDDESDASAAPGGSSSSSDAGKGSKGSNRSRDKSRGKTKRNKKQKLDDEDDEEEMDVESIMCTTCGGGEDEENMLLCDGKGCENAYHQYCLSIPISSIPVGDWFCDECLQAKREEEDKKRRIAAGEKIEDEEDDDDWHEEFGFGEGKVFTLESFKKMADNFKRKWFRTDNPDSIAVAQAEEEFWRIVNTCEVLSSPTLLHACQFDLRRDQPHRLSLGNHQEYVQVHYGSDLCTSAHGSGFPEPTGLPELDCGWNPRVLATVKVRTKCNSRASAFASSALEADPCVCDIRMYAGISSAVPWPGHLRHHDPHGVRGHVLLLLLLAQRGQLPLLHQLPARGRAQELVPGLFFLLLLPLLLHFPGATVN